MSDSVHLGLPFVAGGQAQKHVTVNEALIRLDQLVHLAVISRGLSSPPGGVVAEGTRYLVADAASGAWAGWEGHIAYYRDGAWQFLAPAPGWRLWVLDEDCELFNSGAGWQRAGEVRVGTVTGATAGLFIIEEEVDLAGTQVASPLLIPDRAVVIGVTGLVLEAITGAASWRLGVSDDDQRYGHSIGVAQGSTVIGVSSTPTAYYGATPILVSASGGSFASGRVRLALTYCALTVPGA